MPTLTAWHAGCAMAAALLALGARWLGDVDGPVFFAALAMAAPGLAGLLRPSGAWSWPSGAWRR